MLRTLSCPSDYQLSTSLILARLGLKASMLTVSMLLQGQLAEAQKQHHKANSMLQGEKQRAFTAQEHIKQQLKEKSNALEASERALADATAAAATSAAASQVSLYVELGLVT